MNNRGLTFLKITIVIISAFYVFKAIDIEKEKNIKEIWSTQYTILPGQSLTIFCNPIKPHKASKIKVYDINEQLVDSLVIDLDKKITPKENEWFWGKSYTNQTIYTPKLKPGLYHLEDLFTFSIADTTAKWIVVIPHLSYLCASDATGANFFTPIKNTNGLPDSLYNTNTQIPYYVNYNTPMLKIGNLHTVSNIINSVYINEKITFVSDFYLFEKYKPRTNQNILFWGYFPFMTSNAAKGIKHHLKNGGTIIIASSNIMNNRVRIDTISKHVIFFGNIINDPIKDSCLSAIQFNDEFSNQKSFTIIGGDYQFAEKPTVNYFTLTSNGKDLIDDKGPYLIETKYLIGVPLKHGNIDLKKIEFSEGELIATLPCDFRGKEGFGTIAVLKKEKGTLIFLPTETWFNEENQSKDWVKNLTLGLLKKFID